MKQLFIIIQINECIPHHILTWLVNSAEYSTKHTNTIYLVQCWHIFRSSFRLIIATKIMIPARTPNCSNFRRRFYGTNMAIVSHRVWVNVLTQNSWRFASWIEQPYSDRRIKWARQLYFAPPAATYEYLCKQSRRCVEILYRIPKTILAMFWISYKIAKPKTRDYFRSKYILILLWRVFSHRHECDVSTISEWPLKYDTCNSILDILDVVAMVSISDFFEVFT